MRWPRPAFSWPSPLQSRMTDPAPQPPPVDLAHLRQWIGRTEEAHDLVTARLAAEFHATFAPHLVPVADGDAPWMLHWCLTPQIAPTSALGLDGHPRRGGFLPPVPLPRRMWAGGSIEARAPLRIGDAVTRRSRIEDVSLKEGQSGRLCFVAVRHETIGPRGLSIVERHDIVYRDAAGAGPGSAARPARDRRADGDIVWTVDASPVLLFRYSAMTFNGHRIHYDEAYVTGTEGYAGLVVHGPLQASLLFNLAATIGGAVPVRFDYRGLSPLTSGTFRVHGRRDTDGRVACWTESADGRIGMDADARFG
jgi:3-methylfumaryl-CoA hydratase